MTNSYVRKGVDGLQKIFLYLIILDWLMLIYLCAEIKQLPFRYGVVASVMDIVFNLILMNLCFKRARRAEDGYLIYPVIAGALLSFCLVGYFFFF